VLPLTVGAVLLGFGAATLVWLRRRQSQQVEDVWRSLTWPPSEERFRTEMIADLPAPARRYLLHAIQPGTPLDRSVRLGMSGSIRMSPDGDLLRMDSEELLAAERGYVWRARIEWGPLSIRGHDLYVDGERRMRWWLAGIVPVVRADGPELSRSAAGRLLGGDGPVRPVDAASGPGCPLEGRERVDRRGPPGSG